MIEKIIAVVFVFIAFAMSIVVISSIDMILENDFYGSSAFDKAKQFVLNFGFTTVQILLFAFSGILLLLNKKWGWVLATLAAGLFTFWAVINLIYVYSQTWNFPSVLNAWLVVLLAAFGYIVFFLNRKAIKDRYEVTKNDYRNLLYYFVALSALKVLEYIF
ncbi:hypothetical protein [Aureisphaera sp.]